jgi:hypothetical protein
MEKKDQPSTCVPRGENMIYEKKECEGRERGWWRKGRKGSGNILYFPRHTPVSNSS